MGRRGALTNVEKSKIIQGLNTKRSTLEISKTIGRDHRTVKKFANKPESCNILKRLAKCGKANIRPPLKDKHKKK